MALSKYLLSIEMCGATAEAKKPVAAFGHPFSKDFFLNIQSEPPLVQFCVIPMSCHWFPVIKTQHFSLFPLLWELQGAVRLPLGFLFWKLDSPNVLSLFS